MGREVRLEVSPPAPDRYVARAAITRSQCDVRPYPGLLDALKVRDEVGIEIEVDLG